MVKPNHDVFVSYNRKDRSFVEFMVRLLEKGGISCFQDKTGLKIFDKLDASLKKAIRESRWLMAIISPSYLQSYWCMFEAIEAIQGEDLERRFLPVVLRYRPDDQVLDETFVLRALRDLDEQVNELEVQIIRTKAYALSAKLDKLHFVRQNLPNVFRQIYERIFPEFSLWDDNSARSTLEQIIHRLAPEAKIDLDSISLDFERLPGTPIVIPRLRELPVLLWKTRVGCQAWKNTPLVVGNEVLVGSAGSSWNEPDAEDGVYCLEGETGTIKWFARTPADANQLLVSKGIVVTGCDDGSVVAFSLRNGSLLWQMQLDSGVVGGPLKLSGSIFRKSGNRESYHNDPVLLVTHKGSAYLLDLHTGKLIDHIDVNRSLIAAPVFYDGGYFNQYIIMPSLDGRLVFIYYDDIYVKLSCRAEVELYYPTQFSENGYSRPLLAASPAVAGGLIIQGLVRETSHEEPPLLAVSLPAGELSWQARHPEHPEDNSRIAHINSSAAVSWMASDPENLVGGFGNLRGVPIILGREVLFAPAYSDALCSLSLDDGKILWRVELGQAMFEQWSSPVLLGQEVYLGRHNGYLHKVNLAQKRLEWSIFLGASENAGMAIPGSQKLPEFGDPAAWISGGSAPILATPVIDRGRLYVGTEEGFMYCVTNLGGSGEL